MTAPLIRVEVHEDTETLATTVSRDAWDGFYLLPEDLVVRFETARQAWDAAQAEVSKYIEEHGLEEQFDDADHEPPSVTWGDHDEEPS